MPGGDVVDVQQDLVAALLVPHLVAGVAGVLQDGADRGLAPGHAQPVGVAGPVVAGGWRQVLGGEPLGDGQVAVAVQEHGEDPQHHGGVQHGLDEPDSVVIKVVNEVGCFGPEVGDEDVQAEGLRWGVQERVHHLRRRLREVVPSDHFEPGIGEQGVELLSVRHHLLSPTGQRGSLLAGLLRIMGPCYFFARVRSSTASDLVGDWM